MVSTHISIERSLMAVASTVGPERLAGLKSVKVLERRTKNEIGGSDTSLREQVIMDF
jgi:hypothetical protein